MSNELSDRQPSPQPTPSDAEKESTLDKITTPDDLPDVQTVLPELKIYSHAPIFYWWPVWVIGYILALVSLIGGSDVILENGEDASFLASSNPGVFFVVVLLLVIVFTNIKLGGIYSVVTVMGVALIALVFALFGWWDNLFSLIPSLSVHMNVGFYLTFSTLLFIIWASSFFIFDRLTYWRIRPGQMTEERVIGGGERSYDTRGMLFEKNSEDLFRHLILGLGAGDLEISTTGARKEEIFIPNVLFVDKKVRAIQKLISVKPDELIDTPGQR